MSFSIGIGIEMMKKIIIKGAKQYFNFINLSAEMQDTFE